MTQVRIRNQLRNSDESSIQESSHGMEGEHNRVTIMIKVEKMFIIIKKYYLLGEFLLTQEPATSGQPLLGQSTASPKTTNKCHQPTTPPNNAHKYHSTYLNCIKLSLSEKVKFFDFNHYLFDARWRQPTSEGSEDKAAASRRKASRTCHRWFQAMKNHKLLDDLDNNCIFKI